MKFGVREICDVVFKANQTVKIGGITFKRGQPVLYIDTAKTSTIEGAASTVYATGGKGNSRLIAWEGEKTLTFTVEDALLSPMGFAVLSGAGLFDLQGKDAQVHCTATEFADENGDVVLSDLVSENAPIFVAEVKDGSFVKFIENATYSKDTKETTIHLGEANKNITVFVDYYVTKTAGVTELQIDAENFAGYYYVEASTLFRKEETGIDLPAEIVFPKVKIQSNFTFNMASTGDPSTFTFTMDAFPAYTMFEKTKKVLCAIQVIDAAEEDAEESVPVTTLEASEKADATGNVTKAEA